MSNRLFQEARKAVNTAVNATGSGQHIEIEKAKNALSSAFANSTLAEKRQLIKMQDELDLLT